MTALAGLGALPIFATVSPQTPATGTTSPDKRNDIRLTAQRCPALQLTAERLIRRPANAPGEDVDRIARRILKQLGRVGRLCARMLDARRVSAKRIQLSRAPADLVRIARDAAETFEPSVHDHGQGIPATEGVAASEAR